MTLRRQRQVIFPVTLGQIQPLVRDILEHPRGSYRYKLLEGQSDGRRFVARIIPRFYPLILSTLFIVNLRPVPSGTQVEVETTSQFFIYGDVFNMYNQYIDEFFAGFQLQPVVAGGGSGGPM